MRPVSNTGHCIDIPNGDAVSVFMNVDETKLSPLAQWICDCWERDEIIEFKVKTNKTQNDYLKQRESEAKIKLIQLLDSNGIDEGEFFEQCKFDWNFKYGHEQRGTGDWLLEKLGGKMGVAQDIATAFKQWGMQYGILKCYFNPDALLHTYTIMPNNTFRQMRLAPYYNYPNKEANGKRMKTPERIVEGWANTIRAIVNDSELPNTSITKLYAESAISRLNNTIFPEYQFADRDIDYVETHSHAFVWESELSQFNPLGGVIHTNSQNYAY